MREEHRVFMLVAGGPDARGVPLSLQARTFWEELLRLLLNDEGAAVTVVHGYPTELRKIVANSGIPTLAHGITGSNKVGPHTAVHANTEDRRLAMVARADVAVLCGGQLSTEVQEPHVPECEALVRLLAQEKPGARVIVVTSFGGNTGEQGFRDKFRDVPGVYFVDEADPEEAARVIAAKYDSVCGP